LENKNDFNLIPVEKENFTKDFRELEIIVPHRLDASINSINKEKSPLTNFPFLY
jgi:hypothetical protein